MSDVSILVPALGKTWNVTAPTQSVKKAFVQRLKQQARKELEEAKADIGEDAYHTQLSMHLNACTAGIYGWNELTARQARDHEDGKLWLLSLILLRNHPDLTAVDDTPAAQPMYEANPAEFDKALELVCNPVPNSRPPG